MPRLYLRLILAAIVVALLSISTGAALAAPPQQVVSDPNLVIPATPGPTARLGKIDLDEGETSTFTLKLAANPGGLVTVGLQNQGLYDVTVSPPSLAFYSDTWDIPQTVTVTAVDDSRVEGREDHQIRLNLSGTSGVFDTGYFGSLIVRIKDNDEAGVILGPETVEIYEGATLTKSITLAGADDEDARWAGRGRNCHLHSFH